jgi:GMP synthase-like glutamine amidotransferase
MRLLVIEHQADAPAGLVSGWAAGRGLAVTTLRPAAGQPLPRSLGPGDKVVVLGSEETAFDDSIPWLADELTFVERALENDVAVLGICFGGQVLARLMGARVYRLGEPEIGWVSVASQRAGLADGPWLAWHRDGFERPAGSHELAAGQVSLQAFSLGPHLGLQFHPEVNRPIVQAWIAGADPPLDPLLAARLLGDYDDAGEKAAANAETLFSAWLDGDFWAAGMPAG